MQKFSELYNSKYDFKQEIQAARELAKKTLVKILRVKKITLIVYNTLYRKCSEQLNFLNL